MIENFRQSSRIPRAPKMLRALIDISSKKEGKVLMRMSSRTGLALIAAILMHSGAAQAAGIGGYLEYSGYQNDLKFDYSNDLLIDGNRIGVGVTYSTNPQGSALFNYRLDAGYVHTWEKVRKGYSYDSNGFSLNNAFGFRVFQNDSTRVWIGPAVGLGFDILNKSTDREFDSGDVKTFTIGGGPQIGVNLAASQKLTVALSAGYQYRYRVEWYGDIDVDDDNAHGSGSYWLANIALMFNTGG